ncbi:MAG: hypothetical protein CL878_13780 [Dehalococcoidia bacterium]|nr:hypothetical protein [Dehalococcoidia bacterium]
MAEASTDRPSAEEQLRSIHQRMADVSEEEALAALAEPAERDPTTTQPPTSGEPPALAVDRKGRQQATTSGSGPTSSG